VFALTWGVYWLVAYYFGNRVLAQVDTLQMAILVAIMFGMGIAVSIGSCELELSQSFLHYAVYFVATLLLALMAGVQLAEPFANNPDDPLIGLPKGSQKVLLPQQPSTPKVQD
jgi:predicted Na+-dependent transporter